MFLAAGAVWCGAELVLGTGEGVLRQRSSLPPRLFARPGSSSERWLRAERLWPKVTTGRCGVRCWVALGSHQSLQLPSVIPPVETLDLLANFISPFILILFIWYNYRYDKIQFSPRIKSESYMVVKQMCLQTFYVTERSERRPLNVANIIMKVG